MLVITKLINVHFRWKNKMTKWSFKTVYDDTQGIKHYYIVTSKRKLEVEKEQGNKIFEFVRKHFPQHKTIVIINLDSECVQYVRVVDHYEIRVNGEFVRSCDDIQEAREAKEEIKDQIRDR